MATIAYPAAAGALERLDLEVWRPGEAPQDNLVGAYRSVLRGRERWQGTARWGRTHRPAVGGAIDTFLADMDDPRNTAQIPFQRQTFTYGARGTVSVMSGVGAGAILDHWQPGMGYGCFVYIPRLRQVLRMRTYNFVGDFARREMDTGQVNVSFRPGAGVVLQAGDEIEPATTIHVRKRSGARLALPNAPDQFGPWSLEFVEDVVL